jgi:hypothetical protein
VVIPAGGVLSGSILEPAVRRRSCRHAQCYGGVPAPIPRASELPKFGPLRMSLNP